jgi:glycosyltransferase involved in cell wall biosynthesis
LKKILFIHHSAGWGGAGKCLFKLIRDLDHEKYSCEVLLLKNSEMAKRLEDAGIVYHVAQSKFYKKYYQFFPHSEAGYIRLYKVHYVLMYSISWLLSRFLFAGKELAHYEYDILHLNSSVLTDWLTPGRKKGKVIIHVREPFRKGKFDLLHYLFRSIIKRNADKIIAISEDNARRLNLKENTVVVYDYDAIPLENPSPVSYTSKRVLYLGGSSTSKGFYTVVDSLQYLDEDVVIYFAGHYATVDKIKNRLKKLILQITISGRKRMNAIQKIRESRNAKLIGMIDDVADYLLNDVCCLISPFEVSHFSCPVFEANLASKPAIVSDVVGMAELIENNVNGIIIPKGNAKALAKAINTIAKNSDMARSMGNSGFEFARERFSPSNILKFQKIYDEL